MGILRRGLLWTIFIVLVVDGLPRMFLGRHKNGFIRKDRIQVSKRPENSGLFGEGTFNQLLDHFSNDTTTWQQRYFFNYQYSNGNNVNFLNIGGEGGESVNGVLGDVAPVIYAEQFGAKVYTLEHRFYGQSRPTADMTVASLAYLSSRQALADIAYFIATLNEQAGVDQKWVVFGGSYSGALALWFRELYPELAVGAVGSSAPIVAQLDFYGYLKVVEDNLGKYRGQSGDCVAGLGNAIDQVEERMQTVDGRAALSQLFGLDPPLEDVISDPNSIAMFYSDLAGEFMGASQYEGMGYVSVLCDTLLNVTASADPVARLATITEELGNIRYTDVIAEVQATDFSAIDDRSWLWQTCTEFGYYQTTDRGSNPFRSTLPLNIYVNTCQDVFGVTVDAVRDSVDSTNAYYGERNFYTATNVVATNGDVDPWHFLGKLDSQDDSVVTYLQPGGTHCEEMFPTRDNVYVQNAQAIIRVNLDKWLNGSPNPVMRRNITDTSGNRPSSGVFVSSRLSESKDQVHRKDDKIDVEAFRQRRNVFTGRFNHGLLPPPTPTSKKGNGPLPPVRNGYITQPVDHFNNTDPRTFQQQFWGNDKWAIPDGPNFLMIGGESPESDRWVTQEDLTWLTFANLVGANVYLLEHRYYGDSRVGANDLQYLTSAQALYDVAHFIQTMSPTSVSKGPWITFGGSYSGALSAWAREWFPELIIGAVGSSGPVEAKLDFYEYLLVVQKALVSNSQACADRTTEAFQTLRTLSLTPEGRVNLSNTFNIHPPWTVDTIVQEIDLQQVFGYIYGDFQGVVQYNDDNAAAAAIYNTTQLCEYMTADKPALDALLDVHIWQSGNATISANATNDNLHFKGLIDYIDNYNMPPEIVASILWTWQTCNEFGYYQTTDYGRSVFGDTLSPVNFYVEMCEQVFGIGIETLQKNVERSLQQYGGKRRFKGTNVVLPNGSLDPWSALGLYDNADPSVVPILIDGTAHCADMYPPKDSEKPGLAAARRIILDNIRTWLSGVPNGATDSSSSSATTSSVDNNTSTSTVTPTTSTAPAAWSILFSTTLIFTLHLFI